MYNKERYEIIFVNFLTNMIGGNSKSRIEIVKLSNILVKEYDNNFGNIYKVLDYIMESEELPSGIKILFFRKLLEGDNFKKLKVNLFELSLK